ncbi:MAG: c-type cytochrome domain-containing protein [Planctomycetaceae bacterium]
MNLLLLFALAIPGSNVEDSPEYSRDIAPILNKYCVGCHMDDDMQGGLSLETWAELQEGGEHGKVVLPAGPESSTLIRRITGEDTPQMPPEDNEGPTADEVKLLKAWIAAGAKGPNGTEPPRKLKVPQIASANVRKPITALDWSPDGLSIASAKFGEVLVADAQRMTPQWRIGGLAGKVNSIRYSRDGQLLAVASGVTGVSGLATIYDAKRGILVRRFSGHRDTLYSAVLSPNKTILATAGYDRKIILWNTQTGEPIRTLSGHNGAIFDLDFSPDGQTLASASADETVKVWNVATGQRLDTRSEPLNEQYVVRFSPDGEQLLGGGADNRIRIWKLTSRSKPGINPLLFARFGHEGPVTHMRFSADGSKLISAAEDRSVKLWETKTFTPAFAFEKQPSVVASLAMAPNGGQIVVGRMNGTLGRYDVGASSKSSNKSSSAAIAAAPVPLKTAEPKSIRDLEPNNSASQAQAITVPATISGSIHLAESQSPDEDFFRFAARKGEQWIVEVKAARNKSPLDSRVAVLTPDGKPIPRILLRAVRDSYFTFRGKNSDTSDDFRVHNWEEMELNEFLYANGEVSRLWLYPRGPDSGFKVYPGRGKRHGFFDTTPMAHALHQPCYIVEPHPPGTQFVPNGLPVFTLNYENDDEPRRKLGKDSKLFFTAPKDGQYVVRIADTRGASGADLKYELHVRQPNSGFKVKLNGANPVVGAGSGREFSVTAERIDGFDGPIRIDIEGMPQGFHATTPLIIEAGQEIAFGTINAEPDAPAPTEEMSKASVVTATAFVHGSKVEQVVNNFGAIKHAPKPKLLVTLKPNSGGQREWSPDRPYELTIAPGETITARVIVERNGFKGRVDFGKDDSGRNLPHGVYIDNIGLNGLMIVEGQTEREFFITAAKWVPETSRLFHLKATAEKGQTAWPIVLHVRRKPTRMTQTAE